MAERPGLVQLLRHPGFVRLWVADGLSNFGTFIFGLALQLLLIQTLDADQLQIGWSVRRNGCHRCCSGSSPAWWSIASAAVPC